ncbi:MAG: adenylyltransferase/cytidyltransferase family protein, partial [Polyangiales bacterium]
MSAAIYPGTFDPITRGHMSIIRSGLVAFDRLVVAILDNPKKEPLFSVAERAQMIRETVREIGADESRVEVD